MCVLRLSRTNTIFSACGYCTSTSSWITDAKATAVRRAVTLTCRWPVNGSHTINRLAVPFRSYS